jgi:hypothetical protein
MRRTKVLARAGVLALLAVPMLLVAPMVGSAAEASGNDGGVASNVVDGRIGSGRIATVPKVSVSPTSGARGIAVTVKGKGYQSGEQVNVYYKTNFHLPKPKMVLICATPATTKGKFSCAGHIPTTDSGALGSHEIQAIGQTSGTVAETPFSLS